MPELPEVETTKRGIAPYLDGHIIEQLIVRHRQLRWRVSDDMEKIVNGKKVQQVERRGKYILVYIESGVLLMHLGMSGSFRVLHDSSPPNKHDHYDLVNHKGQVIRYHDPRKFGCLLYQNANPYLHPLLSSLGVEPLTNEFDGYYLYSLARNRNVAIKPFIMNSKIIVGVGNIYASESLFLSGIHPLRACSRIAISRMQILADMIKTTLQTAIDQGGTTLQDFLSPEAKPGYFQQTFSVYNRQGKNCWRCNAVIRRISQAQRSTFYCPSCQH